MEEELKEYWLDRTADVIDDEVAEIGANLNQLAVEALTLFSGDYASGYIEALETVGKAMVARKLSTS